jgi:hypothetical protein
MSQQIMHLWAAYIVTWTLLGGYSICLWRKWSALKK